MHEVELGVWKSLLQHLIRMLHCQGPLIVHKFNSRYVFNIFLNCEFEGIIHKYYCRFCQVAPFGSSIRRFEANVSDLSKLAARNYEDILQCSIPCFEGLFPEPHNSTILDLLYIVRYWHSLAKLHMHTDTSLRVFREVTAMLGDGLRYFAILAP